MNKDPQVESDILIEEAKIGLKRMFGIREGESNGQVERIVDCIVMASVLQCVSVMKEVVFQDLPKKENESTKS
jgi:hypothetical protein